MPAAPRVDVVTTSDLLATVPYLFGFHPTHCIVVVAVRAGHIHFALRHDLLGEDPEGLVAMVAERDADSAFVVGYGSEAEVGVEVAALSAALCAAGVPVLAEIRVDGGRYRFPGGPPEGFPFDFASTEVAADATFQGLAPRRDRAALVAEFAPVSGPEQEAMSVATTRAEERFQRLARRIPDRTRLQRSVLRAGLAALSAARRSHRGGRRLTDGQAAWLGVLLMNPAVFDHAWTERREDDLGFWIDLVRRVQGRYVCAPACLVSLGSWQSGQGVEARVALDRSLAADPEHVETRLLDTLLNHGVRPGHLRGSVRW